MGSVRAGRAGGLDTGPICGVSEASLRREFHLSGQPYEVCGQSGGAALQVPKREDAW